MQATRANGTLTTAQPDVRLAPGAEENGLANMLAELVRQNLAAKPHKVKDFRGLRGNIAIVADDVDVALTLRFEHAGSLTIHDGIVGIPAMTIRGPSDAIMALSNMPLATPLGLPIPDPRDTEAMRSVRTVVSAMRSGKLHVYGAVFHIPLLLKLSRVMSVNG
jgi:hypothetical protein